MDWLRVIGDGLWIASLSIIFSASMGAWKRIPAAARMPLQWNRAGAVSLRAPKAVALLALPLAAFFLGVMLLVANRNAAAGGSNALILFGVRATVAALVAILHLRWLQAALKTLEDEGSIER